MSVKEKLRLLKIVDSRKSIRCAFRAWNLCEYPILSQNTSHSWTMKSRIEKPRLAIIVFQTSQTNNLLKQSGQFDHCSLKNLKVHLNSKVYPYKDFNIDFSKNIVFVLYKSFSNFQKSYYERDYCQPLLGKMYANYFCGSITSK